MSCLFLHELGHVLAAYLTGGWITEFVLMSLHPHVRIAGGSTPAESAFRAASGSGLFLIVYFGCLLLPRRHTPLRRLVLDLLSCFAVVELLGWILSSLLASHGAAADDAVLFLAASGMSRYVVVTVCMAIGITGALVFRQNSANPASKT